MPTYYETKVKNPREIFMNARGAYYTVPHGNGVRFFNAKPKYIKNNGATVLRALTNANNLPNYFKEIAYPTNFLN